MKKAKFTTYIHLLQRNPWNLENVSKSALYSVKCQSHVVKQASLFLPLLLLLDSSECLSANCQWEGVRHNQHFAPGDVRWQFPHFLP